MRKGLLVLLLGLCATCSSVAAQSSPITTVKAALLYEQNHDNSTDITFNRRNIDIRKKWLTRGLYDLHLIELAREEEEAKLRPDDKPYFGDGMDFGPMKEVGCFKKGKPVNQRFSVRSSKISGKVAIVPVRFYYPGCGEDSYSIYYRFQLVKTSKGWLIDDVDYGKNGTLRRDLQRIQ